jgi:hypothetical protein
MHVHVAYEGVKSEIEEDGTAVAPGASGHFGHVELAHLPETLVD